MTELNQELYDEPFLIPNNFPFYASICAVAFLIVIYAASQESYLTAILFAGMFLFSAFRSIEHAEPFFANLRNRVIFDNVELDDDAPVEESNMPNSAEPDTAPSPTRAISFSAQLPTYLRTSWQTLFGSRSAEPWHTLTDLLNENGASCTMSRVEWIALAQHITSGGNWSKRQLLQGNTALLRPTRSYTVISDALAKMLLLEREETGAGVYYLPTQLFKYTAEILLRSDGHYPPTPATPPAGK